MLNASMVSLGVGLASVASFASAVACFMALREPEGGHAPRAQGLARASAALFLAAWGVRSILAVRGGEPLRGVDVGLGLQAVVGSLALAARPSPPEKGAAAWSWSTGAGGIWLALVGFAWTLGWLGAGPEWTAGPWGAFAAVAWAAAGGLSIVPYGLALAHVRGSEPGWAVHALPWGRAALAGAFAGFVLETRPWHPGTAWSWGARGTLVVIWLGILVVLLHGLVYGRKRRFLLATGPLAAGLAPAAAVAAALPVALGAFPGETLASVVGNGLTTGPVGRALVGVSLATALAMAVGFWTVPWRRGALDARLSLASMYLGAGLAAAVLVSPAVGNALLSAGGVVIPGRPWAAIALAATVVGSWPLVAAVARVPVAPGQGAGLADWFVMGRMVSAGMAALLGGLLLLLLVALGAPDSVSAPVLTAVALVAVVPFLLILGMALANQAWGARTTVAVVVAGAVLVVGLLSSTSLPTGMVLLGSAAAFAAAGALAKTYQSCSPTGPWSLRLGGFLLVANGLVMFLDWGAGPTLSWIARGGSSPGLVVAGLAAGVVAVSAGVHALRGERRGWVYVGCAAAVAFGPRLFGLGTLSVFLARSGFASVSARPDFTGLLREHRKAVVYATHWAFAVALLGYSASGVDPIPHSWDGSAALLVSFGWAACVVVLACLGLIPFLQDGKDTPRAHAA